MDPSSLPIAKPPWSGAGKKIERKLRKALYDHQMLDECKGKVAIALSGGKDSLTLLFMLKAISGYGFPPLSLTAIFVEGEYSCGAGITPAFLQAICDAIEVPLIVKHSGQKLEELQCYSCARERRKLIFDAAKASGAQTIAFGHHLDDNVETLMMNLLHKAEFAGNMPIITMKKYGVTLIRPLIYVNEQEITAFAEQHGFRRIMCQCPVGQHSMRRKAKELLQEIEETFPNARINLSKAALEFGSDKALTP